VLAFIARFSVLVVCGFDGCSCPTCGIGLVLLIGCGTCTLYVI
jgi:hypothetical protein